MEIKIESGRVALTQTSKKTYTNCKLSDGSWMNIWGDQTENFGKTVNINEPQLVGKTKWTSIDKSKPEVKPESIRHDGISLDDYQKTLDLMWGFVSALPGGLGAQLSDEARAAMCNTAMINYCQGKIIIQSDEPPEDEPAF
jgi:hypothetical protein